ncbi:MAG: biopolymer transporter ExbD [Planctomycetaceae bacterium]
MLDGGGFGGKKKKKEEVDLDITPMIDVTFLLLIFFMVTSTMQATPDKDIPPSKSGENANAGGFKDLTILSPRGSADAEIQLEGRTVTLEQLKADLTQIAAGGKFSVMIYAERDVKSGSVGEIEQVIGEVATESGVEIGMAIAVRDQR